VYPLPAWLDAGRLLGSLSFVVEAAADGSLCATALLPRAEAADVAARLRGVGLDGRKLVCDVNPSLPRAAVRAARLQDARRRRDGSPGFTRKGVQLDDEGRFSLTPEALALELGQRAAGLHVIDAGCGVGGNAIGFARGGAQVTAIEWDAQRLGMARRNAALYGVADRIEFVAGDAIEVVPRLAADLLFVDPPWGTAWDRTRTSLGDFPLLAALMSQPGHSPLLWAKVPASFEVSSAPTARARAVFGAGAGDAQRIKFVLLERSAR
jgi:hypothetical protein